MSQRFPRELAVDEPAELSASWALDVADRRLLDEQVRGIQTTLVDLLIRGKIGSWFQLHDDSAAVVAGDVFAVAPDNRGYVVTRASAAALLAAGGPTGISLESALPGRTFRGVVLGAVPPSVTGLTGPGVVRVNPATARCEVVAEPAESDYLLGHANAAAVLILAVGTMGPPGPMGSLPEPGPAGEALLSDGEDWVSAALPTGTPVTIGLTNHPGTATDYVLRDHRHAHGDQPGGTLHALATHAVPGFMSAEDKEKLDGLEGGSASDTWPSECALVYDFTKPATVAVARSVSAVDIANDFSATPEYVPPPSINGYIRILAPSSNAYPVEIGGTDPHATAERYLQTGQIPIKPGYLLLRVCAQAVGRSWIAVEFTGAAGTAWFNLTTVATGTLTGAAFLDSSIESDGHAGCVCDILIDAYTTGGTLQIYVCDADGSLISETQDSPVTAIRLLQFDVLHGTAGVDIFQQTVERIDNQGSRRGTAAWQDENEASQPPIVDGYTSLLPTAGALFGGDHGGLGINAKHLRILDPAGSYDLIRQLSAPGSPWTLYVVCSLPDNDSVDRPLFTLVAADTREVSAFFYGGDVVLRDRNGASICTGEIVHPVGSGMHLFAFYYGGRTLRVGADDALGSIYLNTNICAEPFVSATIGGTGAAAFIPYYECRTLMQLVVFVPMACAPLSDLDTAIRAKIATDFGVTTLLET